MIEQNEKIEIRRLSQRDLEEILKIQKETHLTRWAKKDYQREIKRKDSIPLVAVTGNKEVCGFAVVRLLTGDRPGFFKSSEIFNIAISTSFQRFGIGQKIFDEIRMKLKEKEVSEIWLEVRESNNRAIKFYRKNGFEQISVRKNYYQKPIENALIFRRALPNN